MPTECYAICGNYTRHACGNFRGLRKSAQSRLISRLWQTRKPSHPNQDAEETSAAALFLFGLSYLCNLRIVLFPGSDLIGQ